jgi:hypothetical protein
VFFHDSCQPERGYFICAIDAAATLPVDFFSDVIPQL